MAALDEIQTLLNAMRDRGAELAAMAEANIAFKAGIASMASSIADIVEVQEKMLALEQRETPEPGDLAIAASIDRLTACMLSKPEEQPQPIIVNVAPAPVNISGQAPWTELTIKVTERLSGLPGLPMKTLVVTRS